MSENTFNDNGDTNALSNPNEDNKDAAKHPEDECRGDEDNPHNNEEQEDNVEIDEEDAESDFFFGSSAGYDPQLDTTLESSDFSDEENDLVSDIREHLGVLNMKHAMSDNVRDITDDDTTEYEDDDDYQFLRSRGFLELLRGPYRNPRFQPTAPAPQRRPVTLIVLNHNSPIFVWVVQRRRLINSLLDCVRLMSVNVKKYQGPKERHFNRMWYPVFDNSERDRAFLQSLRGFCEAIRGKTFMETGDGNAEEQSDKDEKQDEEAERWWENEDDKCDEEEDGMKEEPHQTQN